MGSSVESGSNDKGNGMTQTAPGKKIIEGLKAAIAYAKGDKSKGNHDALHREEEMTTETTAEKMKAQREKDFVLLESLSSERERHIADAATRLAYTRAADWLAEKQSKAKNFPGSNTDHAKGCEAAYQNGSQELYLCAYKHGDDQ